MSAQHHRRTFRQWLADPFGRRYQPQPTATGWTRNQTVYPVRANATLAAGHGYRMVQATGALLPVTTMQQAIPQADLSASQLTSIANRWYPQGIDHLPTAPDLKPEQLPLHVSQKIPVATGRLGDNQQIGARARQMQALKHQPTTQIVPMQMPQMPEPVCTPLTPQLLPDWLKDPVVPTVQKKKSGFLLSANEVILPDPTEEEMKPDLSDIDPDATMQRPRVKKESE